MPMICHDNLLYNCLYIFIILLMHNTSSDSTLLNHIYILQKLFTHVRKLKLSGNINILCTYLIYLI